MISVKNLNSTDIPSIRDQSAGCHYREETHRSHLHQSGIQEYHAHSPTIPKVLYGGTQNQPCRHSTVRNQFSKLLALE